MSGGAIAAAVAAAAVGVGASIYSSNKQAKAQKRAADQQARISAQNRHDQQVAFNRENQKEVDTSGILDQNTGASNAPTLLTGVGGVDQKKLTLGGGSSLLGG